MMKKLKLDTLGMGASIICALHCMAIPFLLSIAATASLGFLQSPWFEFGILGLAFVFICLSLIPSYKKHLNVVPLVLAGLGIAAVVLNHILWGHEYYILSFCGAILITTAHYKNYKLS